MSPTHRIIEGRYTGSQCTFLCADRDGVLVDLCGMLVTLHPSALRPIPPTLP